VSDNSAVSRPWPTTEVRPNNAITSYHAHIYFEGPEQRRAAEILRGEIAERFSVLLGRWHENPIGPHARPMYQLAFGPEVFERLVPWLMLNRKGLAIIVHPNTGRPKDDHLAYPLWLGEVLPIENLHYLVDEEPSEPPPAPNTTPTVAP